MLGGRKLAAMIAGETLEGPVDRGCPQRGVLFPLLCSLIVNKLITGLNENSHYTMSKQLTLLSSSVENSQTPFYELLQEVLSIVQQWHDRTRLVIVPFTR